jgi:predicted glutamine amidotransferase
MCRLFAYKTENPEKDNELLIQALIDFRQLSKDGLVPVGEPAGHLDGWGIVAYEKGSPFLYMRFVGSIGEDLNFENALDIIKRCQPDLVVAHIRKTFCGDNSVQNTHPFVSDDVSFCHNGTISSFTDNQTESDSHKFFRKIVSEKNDFTKVYNEISSSHSFSAMNMIFSDGKNLTVTRNWNKDYPRAEEMNFKDYYTLYSFKTDTSLIICSEKLKSTENLETTLLDNKSINIF